MKKVNYLMEEDFINTKGMPAILRVMVSMAGVGLIAGLMPVAYAFDKTEELWQKVK